MELETLRARVALFLMDEGRLIWPEGLLDEAIRHAMEDYSRASPRVCVATLTTLPGAPAALDLNGLDGFSGLLTLHWPPQGENQLRGWVALQTEDGWQALLLDGATPPPGETITVVYAAAHSLNGLDGATFTSVEGLHSALLARGAAAYAAQMRCVERSEGFLPEHGSQRLADWARAQMDAFQSNLDRLRAGGRALPSGESSQSGWGAV